MKRFSLPVWLANYLTCYQRTVAAALVLGLIASGFAALLMFTSGYLISATALAGTTLFSIMIPVACVQLFGFGRPLARYLERLASHDWVLRVTSDLRLSLFLDADKRADDPARERAMGEYLGLLSDDVAHLQNLYLRVVFPTAIAYLLAIGASLVFGFFSAPFALVMILSFAAVALLLPLCCLLATRGLMLQAKTLKADEYAALTDDVSGALDWMLAGRSGGVIARHDDADGAMRALESRGRLVVRTLSLIASVALALLLCGVVSWSGVRFGSGAPGVNWIAAFALGFFPLIETFIVLPSALSDVTAHRESVERLDEHVGQEGQEGHAERVERADAGCASAAPVPDGGSDGDSDSGSANGSDGADACGVSLEGVTYSYPHASKLALDNISLEIGAGESVAVLGRSGAGKTTVARMMCGSLSPDSGTIAGCSAGRVGFVGQNPYLFNRSLRENLVLGDAVASDDRLADILARVGLGEKLAALPDGLDTVIGETGTGFSGGEAHRIALARVLVADVPVVVVDEPFSALDPDTERGLLDTLLTTFADRTLVVITHHLAQIERFDRVVFIEDARVALDGAPRVLMQENDFFRRLVSFDR